MKMTYDEAAVDFDLQRIDEMSEEIEEIVQELLAVQTFNFSDYIEVLHDFGNKDVEPIERVWDTDDYYLIGKTIKDAYDAYCRRFAEMRALDILSDR